MLAAVLALGSTAALGAQQSRTISLPLLDTPGSWVVEVSTSGGFSGRGKGSFAVRTNGTMTCIAPLTCTADAVPSAVALLSDAVAHLQTTTWGQPNDSGICRDCFLTTFVVRVRRPDGGESRAVFSWTDVTFKNVPDDVRTAYERAAMMVDQRH